MPRPYRPSFAQVSSVETKRTSIERHKVILGVTQSDSHVVANRLLSMILTQHGYQVVNLGVCTPIEDFIDAYLENQDALCVAMGNLNGHAITDTRGLMALKKANAISCPFIIGVSPNSRIMASQEAQKELLGVNGFDHIMNSPDELLSFLILKSPSLSHGLSRIGCATSSYSNSLAA